MGASSSKSITPQLPSRKLRVNNMIGPTNSLLKPRNQSRVKNVVRPNLIKNSYAMRLGNIEKGTTVEPELPVLSNGASLRRSSTSSTISLNPSQITSSNVSSVPSTNGILRTSLIEQIVPGSITPIPPIRSRSSSLASLSTPPLSRTASPISFNNNNNNNNNNGTGVIEGGFRRRRTKHTHKRKRIHRTHKNRKPKRGTRHRK